MWPVSIASALFVSRNTAGRAPTCPFWGRAVTRTPAVSAEARAQRRRACDAVGVRCLFEARPLALRSDAAPLAFQEAMLAELGDGLLDSLPAKAGFLHDGGDCRVELARTSVNHVDHGCEHVARVREVIASDVLSITLS